MVYCGKPSKACFHCRKRRIKCDLIDPTCSQCLRANKPCTYRDQLDLSFRNENERTMKRVSPDKLFDLPEKVQSNLTQTTLGYLSNGNQLTFDLPGSLSSGEDPGLQYVNNNYVTNPYKATDEYLSSNRPGPPIWSAVFVSESLSNIMSSIGLAGMANISQNGDYALLARKKYTAAVCFVKTSLGATSLVDFSDVARVVLFMGIFEMMTSKSEDMEWGMHALGAAAIVTTKVSRGCLNPISAREQTQICTGVLLKCIFKGEVPSTTLVTWAVNCMQLLSPIDAPAAFVIQTLSKLSTLIARAKKNNLVQSKSTFDEALKLKTEISSWQGNVPAGWKYEVVSLKGFSHDSMQACLRYRCSWIARICLFFRLAQLLSNELLIMHILEVKSGSAEHATLYKECLNTIANMSKGICRGFFSDMSEMDDMDTQAAPGKMRSYFLTLHPLAMAAAAIGVPQETYEWALHMLEETGRRLGINQALAMAELIKKRRENWQRLYKF